MGIEKRFNLTEKYCPGIKKMKSPHTYLSTNQGTSNQYCDPCYWEAWKHWVLPKFKNKDQTEQQWNEEQL